LRIDFDALGERAKVIAAVAAALGSHLLAKRPLQTVHSPSTAPFTGLVTPVSLPLFTL